MSLYAVGDIHGNYLSLETLIEKTSPDDGDTLVFLGDFIDRGLFSNKVIDYILDLTSKTNVITLRGNHEVMMLEARKDYDKFNLWQGYGGFDTLASYYSDFEFSTWTKQIPKSHWEFVESTQNYYETDEFIFVHASVDHEKEMEDQHPKDLFWSGHFKTEPHFSRKTIICGHVPQKNGLPHDRGHSICIDTWAGMMRLTCLKLDDMTYLQANEEGEVFDWQELRT